MKKIKTILKKYYWIFIIVVLLFPIRINYQDGGSYSYNSILYKYIVWNPMPNNIFEARETKQIFKVFPFNFHSSEYYLELKPEKRFAYIYDDNEKESIKDYLECNIGNFSLVRRIDGEVFEKKANTISPAFQNYYKELSVKSNTFIYLDHLYNKIEDLKIYKPNSEELVQEKVSYFNNEGLSGLKLENVNIGKYIISFKTTLEKSEIWYSFQINVV